MLNDLNFSGNLSEENLFQFSFKLQNVILNQFINEMEKYLNANFDRFIKVCVSEQGLCTELFSNDISRMIMSFHRVNTQYKYFSEELNSDESEQKELCESFLMNSANNIMSYTIKNIINLVKEDLFTFVEDFDQTNKFSNFCKNSLGEPVYSLGISVKYSSKTFASLDNLRNLVKDPEIDS